MEERSPVVAVFGDPFLDRYWIGSSSRLSPEAPIPVVLVEQVVNRLGGAANVTANLGALGVEAIPCYDTTLVPIKNRLVVGGQQLARWDEHDYCYPPKSWPTLDVDGIVVADYSKGSMSEEVIQAVFQVAGSLNIPLFVDTKKPYRYDYVPVQNVFWFPNKKEYSEWPEFYNKARCVVLKESEEGLSLLSYGQRWAHFPARARRVVSVCGAGDTVLAAFVAKYLEDGSWESKANRAAKFANDAAAVAVGKPYTSVVTKEEIERVGNDY